MERPLPTFTIPEHVLACRIGGGSAGDVWLARDALGMWRAVKFVCRGADGDESTLRRELEGLRRYEPVSRSHPALLDILFTGTDPATGTLYYVMELADDASGTPTGNFAPSTYRPATLSRRLRLAAQALAPEDRRLPAAEVLLLAHTLAEGLAHLHSAGLIHRDLKPGNIVFVGGRPCLADCGLVSTSAVARSFVGTEGFIPPEGPGTPAADVYALGKLLYEAAFGLDRNDWPELPAWFGNTPDAPLLRELLAVMRRACATDLAARYRDAGEMLADLILLTDGGSLVRRGERRNRRRRLAWAALLVATLAGLALCWSRRSPLSAEALPGQLVGLQDVQPVDVIPERPPRLEFYAISKNQLQFLTSAGELNGVWSPQDNPIYGLHLAWARDLEGTGTLQRCVSWSSGTNCTIAVLSQYNEKELHRFTTSGQVIAQNNGSFDHLSVIHPELIGDLDGDGRPELVAVLQSEPSRRPGLPPLRQLVAFDFASGAKKWAADVIASAHGCVVQVTNRPGGVALLAGTSAPDNGHVLLDGTDDSHSHIYAFGPHGERLWHHETGGIYTVCWPKVITWLADGATEFYVRAAGTDDFLPVHPEQGRIIRYDSAGEELGRFSPGPELNSWHVTDLDGEGTPELLVTDSRGTLHVLDRKLAELRTVELTACRLHRVEIQFVGEGDLDGDGQAELVFTVAQCQPLSAKNAGSTTGTMNSWRYEDIEVMVLNRRLETVARHRLATKTTRNPAGIAQLFDLNHNGHPVIVVLDIQPQMLRWRK